MKNEKFGGFPTKKNIKRRLFPFNSCCASIIEPIIIEPIIIETSFYTTTIFDQGFHIKTYYKRKQTGVVRAFWSKQFNVATFKGNTQ